MIKESLDDILRVSIHSVQSGVQSVLYILLKQVLLDPISEQAIRVTSDAHKI